MPRKTKDEQLVDALKDVTANLFAYVDLDRDGKVLGVRIAHRELMRVALPCGWLPVLQELPRSVQPMAAKKSTGVKR